MTELIGNKPIEDAAIAWGRAKERRYYEVPWPVAEYDSAPTVLG